MARKKVAEVVLEPATPAEVRAWAAANNIEVSSKGRLSAAVKEAFTSQTGRAIL